MKRQKGFSLIELLIVVAIILIIAAIAIPNLLRARISANESAAAATVRTINTAEVSYTTTFPTVGFSLQLKDLGPGADCNAPAPDGACLVDKQVAAGAKSGYAFVEAGTATNGAATNTNYTVTANASAQGTTGVRSFFSDESGVIRVAAGAGADGTSDPLN